jgi:thiol-disulfide isomerase/thioredoxin
MAADPTLLEFYGTECVHCNEMKPLVQQLEKETGKELTRFEIWHNQTNLKKFQELDKGRCGGVPFFLNTKTGKFICGSAPYDALKKWALGM